MSVRPIFAWYDLWIGIFIDRQKRRVYIFPLPCIGLVVTVRAPDADAREARSQFVAFDPVPVRPLRTLRLGRVEARTNQRADVYDANGTLVQSQDVRYRPNGNRIVTFDPPIPGSPRGHTIRFYDAAVAPVAQRCPKCWVDLTTASVIHCNTLMEDTDG